MRRTVQIHSEKLVRQVQQLGKLTVGEALTAHKAGVETSIEQKYMGMEN